MKKKILFFAIFIHIMMPMIVAQNETDTLYYDKNWKGVGNKLFASYYRIIPTLADINFRKPFKDYYITGELQAEGEFLTIDKYDDSKSIFDGEITIYKKDGLISSHQFFKEGKLHGICTEFSEDGNLCVQIEYSNGEPLYDYYVISNKDGLCSKIKFLDNKPIHETPSTDEIQVEHKNGESWPYYNKNGIMIGMTNYEIKDYGKYFQIPIIISNNSMHPIEFDPNNIVATLTDKEGNERNLKVYSAEKYMKKVQRRQSFAMAAIGFAEGMAAASAGYSTSTTNTSYSGYSSNYGNAYAYGNGGHVYSNYSGTSSYYGSSLSTTTSYNGAAAYQAQIIASNRMATFENALLSERNAKNEGYLKKTTIYPGETISGYINIQRKKGLSMTIIISINEVMYRFPWNIKH